MKTTKTVLLLLGFVGLLYTASAQQTPLDEEQIEIVTKKMADHLATFSVLKRDTTIKHGNYVMFGHNWKGEGKYVLGERTGVWTFSSTQHGMESQYDFTNLKLTYERAPAEPDLNAETLVYKKKNKYEKKQLDSKAFFIGGDTRLFSYMAKNLRYPAAAQRAGVQGTVVLAVELSETGQVLGYKVENAVSSDLDNESIRVFELIPHDWFPAIVDGKPVRSIYYLPFRYTIM